MDSGMREANLCGFRISLGSGGYRKTFTIEVSFTCPFGPIFLSSKRSPTLSFISKVSSKKLFKCLMLSLVDRIHVSFCFSLTEESSLTQCQDSHFPIECISCRRDLEWWTAHRMADKICLPHLDAFGRSMMALVLASPSPGLEAGCGP